MFKRYELHNHTTESDASISCRELYEIMRKDRVDVFAITDHNTISGHRIIRSLLEEKARLASPDEFLPDCVYGMEYTTYYGHILCLNLERYVPWDSIDKNRPELLLEAAKKAGAIAGIAHPFSYGDPFARGCHFDMTIHDFSAVDFIEIFNDLEPLHEVNEKGLLWWEDLVLSGLPIAATCGMDLHGDWDMSMQFATYAEGEKGGDPAEEIAAAIAAQKTWVSKGPLLVWERIDDDRNSSSALAEAGHAFRFTLTDTRKPGYRFEQSDRYLITLRGKDSLLKVPMKRCAPERPARPDSSNDNPALFSADVPADLLQASPVWIPKLYRGEDILENLVCVAPPLKV